MSSSEDLPPLEDVLSKSQRNELFVAIEQTDAPVTEFDLAVRPVTVDDQKTDICVRIGHLNSQSYFAIIPRPKGIFEIFGRLDDGEKLATDYEMARRFFSVLQMRGANKKWSQVPPVAGKWARKIIELGEEYKNTPDLWAELRQGKKLLAAPHENTPFAEAEQAEISNQMQQIKEYIKTTYELTGEQIAEVEERLDQADQASRRMGRKDWLLLFNGAVFSLVLSDLVPSQAVQHILLMTLHGLGHLFGIGGPPPSLPPQAG